MSRYTQPYSDTTVIRVVSKPKPNQNSSFFLTRAVQPPCNAARFIIDHALTISTFESSLSLPPMLCFISTHQTTTKAQQQGGEMSSRDAHSHQFQGHDDIWPQKYNIYERALSSLPLVDDERRKEEYGRRMVCSS